MKLPQQAADAPRSPARGAAARAPALVALAGALLLAGCGLDEARRLVVYTSQDQVYAEPLLRDFERQTGVRVEALFDSEAVKTVGLANRLLAERSRPRADVFWNNEELRTRLLQARGVLAGGEAWAVLGYRSRRLTVNTKLLSLARAPARVADLTNRAWSGKIALAYPMFGSTSTHFLALRQRWGTAAWETWCRALQANRPLLVDGNSVVARLVGRGEAWIGLSDSDDILAEQQAGSPVAMLPLAEDLLLIPNTAAVVQGCPHPQAAARFLAFLRSEQVARKLIEAHALEWVSPPAAGMDSRPLDWPALLAGLDEATAQLETLFLR
jgi:iron(III) transport system substrate-binding protein